MSPPYRRLLHVTSLLRGVPQLKPWRLETDDTKLLDLMPFLEAVVRMNVADVRAVVKSYEGEDIPTAFKYNTCPGSLTTKHSVRGGGG